MPKLPPKVIPRSRTGEIRREQQQLKGNPNERVELLLLELKLYGFMAAKGIAAILAEPSGEMDCPMCGQKLRYSTAPNNGHFAAKCSRKACISMME